MNQESNQNRNLMSIKLFTHSALKNQLKSAKKK